MGTGNQPGAINVTPLIDVLLVLLIIFMVILPHHSVGLDTRVPAEPDKQSAAAPPPPTVIVSIREDRGIWINKEPVSRADLARRLGEIYARSPNRPLFVHGAPSLEFADIATVIDAARGVGIFQTALITEDPQ